MTRLAITALLTVFALGASGCLDDTLQKRSIVAQWRVLAIVAEGPVARFGEDVRFEALVVDPEGERALHGVDGVEYRWSLCVRPERVPGLGGLQYDPESPSQGCGASELPEELRARLEEILFTSADGSFTVPALLTATLLESLPAVVDASGFPPELIESILATTGIPLVVELRVSRDGQETIVAFKRFLLTTAEGTLGTNPPPPRFRICTDRASCQTAPIDGDTWLAGVEGETFRCAPEDGATPVVDAGAEVILDPEHGAPGGLDALPPWLEEYQVLDIRGELLTVEERAYYSWFSTGGAFDQEITRSPVEQEIWRAPAEAGTYPLWLGVRDGHGGTSACRAEIEVR